MTAVRTLLRVPVGATRAFSTSLHRYQDSAQAGPSRSTPTPKGGFMDEHFSSPSSSSSASQPGFSPIQRLFDSAPSSQPILPHTQLIGNVDGPVGAFQRGYQPTAVPPMEDPILNLFTNMIMQHGRKGDAQRNIAEMLRILHETTNQNPVDLVHQAVLMAAPSFRIISIVRGAKRIYSPRALGERQRLHQSIAWIKKASEKQKKRFYLSKRLAREILLVLEGSSEVYGWQAERHKTAMLNRSNMMVRQ